LGALANASGLATITGNGARVDTITVGAGFTNALRINLATGNDVISASASAAALTIAAAAASINTSDDLVGGTSAGDVLSLTADNSTTGAVFGGTVSGIETITVVASTTATDDIVIVTANGMVTDNTGSITVNAAALTDTGAFLNFTSNENSTATINVTGGAGNDLLTAGTEKSNFSGGGGIDTFTFTSAMLTEADTISGGLGVDILSLSDASTVVDLDFTGITSVETLTVVDAAQTITLGALANASGLATITGNGARVDTITVGAGFTNALRINLATGNDSISASASAAALTIAAPAASITTNDALVGGTSAGDVLSLTADNSTTGAVFGATVSAIETITVVASITVTDDIVITTANAMVTTGRTLTVNAAALTDTGAFLTFVGSDEADTDATVVVTGGAGNDLLTAGAEKTNFSGGGGIDTFTFASANLTLSDTISGGLGVDILLISDASTVEDADFTNITSVETLTVVDVAQTITLGAFANASGLATITGNGARVDTVTVGAGFTNALRINLATGNDNINASASAAALTIAAAAASITTNDALVGGTSTGDVLSLTADNDGTGAVFGGTVSGIDTITVVASTTATDDIVVTMAANNTQIASGATLTVNAAALTDTGATLTFVGTASETDGFLSITGGAGADTITGGSAADTINGGGGADVITAGAGADSLTGGAAADTFIYTAAAQSGGVSVDTITDFTTTSDKLRVTLDYSAQTVGVVVNATVTTAVAGLTNAQAALTGERGQYIYDTTNSRLYVNVNNDNLVTALDYTIGITAASTAANTIADGDLNFVITGGSGADVITAGGGADSINGGLGVDQITSGTGIDNITVNVNGSGAVTVTTVANPAVINVSGLDIYSVSETDIITILSAAGSALTFTAYVENSARDSEIAVDASGGAVTLGEAGFVKTFTGTYTAATGVFTTGLQATVADLLVVYDIDGVGAGTTFQAVVLVGVDQVSITTSGVITSLAAVS
jgi:Ca2+-binding RTX toxin-like protein